MRYVALTGRQNFTFNRKSLTALLLTSVAFSLSVHLAMPTAAYAQTIPAQNLDLNIRSQNLGSALAILADRAGVRLLMPSSLVRGKTSPTLNGTYSIDQALNRLLAGSQLQYRFTANNAVTIFDPALAETHSENRASEDGSILLDTITVSGATNTLADVPYQSAGSKTYISSEKIERFRGTSVGDMLSGTPGVLSADNRNGAALDVNIRGMQGQGRVPVSVDGAIQETNVWRGYSGIAGRSYVDPDFIGGVMIEKGPSSAADGSGAIGGMVRMNTIGVNDILRPDKDFGIRIKGGFNSNSSSVPAQGTKGGYWGGGAYPNASLPSSFGDDRGVDRPAFLEPTGGTGSIAGAYRSEYVDVLAAYARRKNGNYYAGTKGDTPRPKLVPNCASVNIDGACYSPNPDMTGVVFEGMNRYRGGEEVLNTSQDNKSVLLKGTIRLPDDHQLDLAFMRYESEYGEIMPSQIMYTMNQGPYQARLNGVTMDTYTAKYKWNPQDNDLFNLKAGFWLTDAELTIPYQSYAYDEPMLANFYGSINRRWGFNADNTSKFDTQWGAVSLSYGGSYSYETLKPGDGADRNNVKTGNRQEYSFFTSGEWKPSDWLKLNASLRYSDYKSTDTGKMEERTRFYVIQNPDGTTYELDEAQYFALPWSEMTPDQYPNVIRQYVNILKENKVYQGKGLAPIFSATVEPWKGIQFYGQYAEAIRLPSLFETTRGFSTAGSIPGMGLDLKPERAKNWEFGFNVLRDDVLLGGDSLRLKASYFDNTVHDYITRTFMSTALGGNSPIVNIDYAEMRGFELQASYDTGRFFGDIAYTRYTHTNFCNKRQNVNPNSQMELCNPGGSENSYVVNQLPPKDSLSLTLGTRAFDEKLTIGGRLTYIGDRGVSGVLSNSMNSGGGTIELVKWKPYTLVDLFASYKVNEQFQIDAAIDNVADRYYMDTLTLGIMPSPGRTFRLNMTTKF
ncbi:TonB-dependent receptor domain-containing protein [Brucellaceae bacterium C25G]